MPFQHSARGSSASNTLFVDEQLHLLDLRSIRGFKDVYSEDLGRDRVEGPAESTADTGALEYGFPLVAVSIFQPKPARVRLIFPSLDQGHATNAGWLGEGYLQPGRVLARRGSPIRFMISIKGLLGAKSRGKNGRRPAGPAERRN